jgi:secreted PhoX family phosphatase
MSANFSRREFCRFLMQGAAGSAFASSFLSSCTTRVFGSSNPFPSLPTKRTDQLNLAPGFQASELIRWGALINAQGQRFGFNNDFIAVQPIDSDKAWMWVNHESVHPGFVSGDWNLERKKSQIDIEMKNVGGSLLQLHRQNDRWTWSADGSVNQRLDAFSKIPFSGEVKIEGSRFAMGTLANCAGGRTPWGSFLSCEENYQGFYGDRDRGSRTVKSSAKDLGWYRHYEMPPEHYGWVVEITPKPFAAKKLISLGRFAHEAATVVTARDGRSVVYMGDDAINECLYKFISDEEGSLEAGTLYVANLARGEWIPLSKRLNPQLNAFESDLEILIYTREAAHSVGASPLDRPEDVEVHPLNGAIFVALTSNKEGGRPFGSILRIEEENGNFLSTRFRSEVFVMGGEKSGIACPDNLCFDSRGHLWVTNDISGSDIGTPLYESFGNNALFVVPTVGEFSGQAFRIAEAPVDAELTGPCFAPDGESLFVSVQHPGEKSRSPSQLTSHWPDGGSSTPSSAVMEIKSDLFFL